MELFGTIDEGGSLVVYDARQRIGEVLFTVDPTADDARAKLTTFLKDTGAIESFVCSSKVDFPEEYGVALARIVDLMRVNAKLVVDES